MACNNKTAPIVTQCGDASEINTEGCCAPTTCPTPTPYFSCASPCEESHCQTVVNQQFLATLKVDNSWNIPGCGLSAILYIPGLRNVQIGSFLWNPSYGYFQVIGFNPTNSQVTVQNNCTDGNAPVGSAVPGCSLFVVTDPPFVDGGGGQPSVFPFVAIDFTAPAVGDCIDITVTTVNGLAVGKNVQIGSGTYRLASIPSSTIINICNDGLGITPGTAVIAKNAAQQYQYPIILIDANPCTNTPVNQGAVVVCKDQLMQPLEGNVVGSLLVLVDADTNEAQWQPSNIDTRLCTVLGCCFTLVPGVATYTMQVADTTGFVVGDILQIGTRDERYEITAILDGTHFQVTVTPVPVVLEDIPEGLSVCVIACCEELEARIDDLSTELLNQCVYQVALSAIPVQTFVIPVVLDPNGYFTVAVDLTLAGPISPSGACPNFIEADVSVGVLLDFVGNGTDVTAVYQEVEAVFDNSFLGPRTDGKMVWTDYASDGKDIVGFPALAPGDAPLFGQLLSPAPRLPIMYHQGDITARALTVGATPSTLRLYYRCLIGDNFPPASVNEVRILASGMIKIFRYA